MFWHKWAVRLRCGHYKNTEQGHNKLNVDVFMSCTISFYFVKVVVFYCVLQLEGILSSCKDLDVQNYPFLSWGWHFVNTFLGCSMFIEFA